MRQMTFAEQPTDTSVEAAEAIKPSVARLRARVHERLVLAGQRGMTDEELQIALALNKRRTLSGRRAIVWTTV